MSATYHEELGKVTSATFELEDHGILTSYVHIDFGGTAQGFGGYGLDEWDEAKNRRVGTAMGCDYILRLLALFDVSSLDKIKGRPVYVLRDEPCGKIIGLRTPAFDGGREFLISDWQRESTP